MSTAFMMETTIQTLGECRFVSPLRHIGGVEVTFRTDHERVLYNHLALDDHAIGDQALSFQAAGAREKIFFDPPQTNAAIVNCGGLCPGLNDIIRGIVTQLSTRYGVTRIYGFRYGYEGLIQRYGH